jgi:hypothetical protein
MCSDDGNWTQLQLGYPIRKSPDQRSVANSPGHIAGSYVLHRLLVPRHPPCALSSLSNHIQKMPQRTRCSRPLCSSQNTSRNPSTITTNQNKTSSGMATRKAHTRRNQTQRPIPQDPTACHDTQPPPRHSFHAPPENSNEAVLNHRIR